MGTGPVQNANPDVANFESQVVEAAEQVPVVVPRGFAYQIDNEPVQYDFEVLEHQVVDAAIEWRIQLYTPRQFNPPITREQSDAAVAVQNERLRIIVDVLIAARENTP
jgi:hypothetical protein